jgi:hypothetical protein
MRATAFLASLCAVVCVTAPAARANDPFEHWRVDTTYFGNTMSALDSGDNLIIGPGVFTKIAPDGTVLFERDPGQDAGLPPSTILRWLAVDSTDHILEAGKQEGGPNTGVIVFRYDSDGNLLWHTITGTGVGGGPEPIRVQADELGDLYVFGETFGGLTGIEPTGKDFLTIKYSSDGVFQWARAAHHASSEEPFDMDVRGGVVAVTGKTGGGFLTVAYDYAGSELWRAVEPAGIWGAEWVEIGAGGQVVICGWAWTGVALDYAGVVIQYDAAGTEDWKLFHNSPAGPVDNLRRLTVADNGDVAAAGWADNQWGWSVIKIDGSGNLLWSQYEPGTSVSWEQANWVTMGPLGEVYVAGQLGFTYPFGPVGTLIKYAPDGTQEWVFHPSMQDNLDTVHRDSTGALLVSSSRRGFRIIEPVLETYCTAKVSSAGCTPAIGWTGTPSVTSATVFDITADQVLNNKFGLFFYSVAGRKAVPFQGGTMCVESPRKRTPIQHSGGNPPPADCSGTYALDFNARIQSGVDPSLTLGTRVRGQYWYRDSASAGTTGLTDAIEFDITP